MNRYSSEPARYISQGMCVIANVQMDEIPETITNSDLDLTINVKTVS